MLLLVAACAPIPTRTEAPLPSVVLNGPGLSILPVWIPNSATLAGAEPMSPAREYPASEVDAIIHSKGVEVIKPVNVALGEPFDGEIQRSFKSTTVIIKLRAVKLPCGSYDLSIHPTAVSHLKNGGINSRAVNADLLYMRPNTTHAIDFSVSDPHTTGRFILFIRAND